MYIALKLCSVQFYIAPYVCTKVAMFFIFFYFWLDLITENFNYYSSLAITSLQESEA